MLDQPLPSHLMPLSRAARRLYELERGLRVLKAISWGPEVAERFFANGARELPEVSYPPFDPAETLEGVADLRPLLEGDSAVHRWLQRTAGYVEDTARLLASAGTPEFARWSKALFGHPGNLLLDNATRPLDLAESLDSILREFDHGDLIEGESVRYLSAEDLRQRLLTPIARVFGEAAPEILIEEHLSAKAVAGGSYIKLRADARFSDLDATQLLHHEAYVHIATSMNGRLQSAFPILGAGHAGTTRTQEGLAVLAELISRAIDPARMHRLADRVIAIQMSLDGADFLDLYTFFRERTHDEFEAFENARRVVRGGLVTGGAPFTKDGVYLEGLLRVHNYLRVAVARGDVRYIRLLFAGKFDLTDMPAILELDEAGVLEPPAYLPPWSSDMRNLVAYLAFARFVYAMDLGPVEAFYDELFTSREMDVS
ncbi:MAG: flavohemoglobin expression-modulating QEGLA motif protein [Alphaproteobacteria bacterium]